MGCNSTHYPVNHFIYTLFKMESLEEMGKKAYQKQLFKMYHAAIEIYSAAILAHGEDQRLLNNRCMCYIQTKDFNKALRDSEKLIKCYPNYKKSYYRRGEILKALERYIEAEEAFHHVLTLDANSDEARQQLLEVQVLEICSKYPFTQREAVDALTHTGNIEDAIMLLNSKTFYQSWETDLKDDDIYYSDEEVSTPSAADGEAYDPLTDPLNPLGCPTLWIGNVTEALTQKMLNDMFAKFGAIKSVHVYYQKSYAFVNYKDATGSGKAMKAFQGLAIGGKNLVIRYPDSALSDALTAATHKKNKRS